MYRGHIVSPATTYATGVVARSTQTVLASSMSYDVPTYKTSAEYNVSVCQVTSLLGLQQIPVCSIWAFKCLKNLNIIAIQYIPLLQGLLAGVDLGLPEGGLNPIADL